MSSTVLFLEKDRELQTVMPAFLRERGFRVECARSVQEARTVLASTPVDAAVVDSLLPGMVGLDFLQEMRREKPALPILLASRMWKDVTGREQLLKELRVARILQKPYTPQELFIWVEQALARQWVEQALAQKPGSGAGKPGIPASIAEELAAANAEYGRHLKRRLASLTDALGKARAGSAEAVEALYYDAHKLHGSAGSFGFAPVGEAAGLLEALVKPARAGHAVDWVAIEAALNALAETIHPPAPKVEAPKPTSLMGAVLVVDDDADWLAEVERMGKAQEVKVLTAQDVDEAVERSRGHWLDGALLHVHLGGPEGGFAAAARLRSEKWLHSLPLAFFSADGDLAHRVAAAHAGGSLYLPKPFAESGLIGAVERLVAARRPERSRVLVLADDEEALSALSHAVAGHHVEVTALSDPFRLLDALAEHRPELLVLDVELPGPSGFDLCRIIRSMPDWEELPILFITTQLAPEFRVAAFEAGADDYLTRPVLREELVARMHSRLERVRLARERSERDALTGLLLRRPFLEALRARLSEGRRQHRPLALCFLDVDHFKRVNDTYGHVAGDHVLARLGRLLSTRFRREDLRGRWGGEEFVVALAGETAASAREILARTAVELAEVRFSGDHGESFQITFSAGIVEAPRDGEDAETLLREADARLYRAKANGRNRIEL